MSREYDAIVARLKTSPDDATTQQILDELGKREAEPGQRLAAERRKHVRLVLGAVACRHRFA